MVDFDLIESAHSGRVFLWIDTPATKLTIEVTDSIADLKDTLDQPPTPMDHDTGA